jgi:hypothetical protein
MLLRWCASGFIGDNRFCDEKDVSPEFSKGRFRLRAGYCRRACAD